MNCLCSQARSPRGHKAVGRPAALAAGGEPTMAPSVAGSAGAATGTTAASRSATPGPRVAVDDPWSQPGGGQGPADGDVRSDHGGGRQPAVQSGQPVPPLSGADRRGQPGECAPGAHRHDDDGHGEPGRGAARRDGQRLPRRSRGRGHPAGPGRLAAPRPGCLPAPVCSPGRR